MTFRHWRALKIKQDLNTKFYPGHQNACESLYVCHVNA